MNIIISVSKSRYDSLLSKKFGDDFIYKGNKYRISSWGIDKVTTIKIDRIGGRGIDDNNYIFNIQGETL